MSKPDVFKQRNRLIIVFNLQHERTSFSNCQIFGKRGNKKHFEVFTLNARFHWPRARSIWNMCATTYNDVTSLWDHCIFLCISCSMSTTGFWKRKNLYRRQMANRFCWIVRGWEPPKQLSRRMVCCRCFQ